MATTKSSDKYEFKAFKNKSESKDSSKIRSYINSRQNISRAQTSITINTSRTAQTDKSKEFNPKSSGIHKKKI